MTYEEGEVTNKSCAEAIKAGSTVKPYKVNFPL